MNLTISGHHLEVTPALREYVLMAKDAWHTPGHSSGDSLRGSPWASAFHEFVGEVSLLRPL